MRLGKLAQKEHELKMWQRKRKGQALPLGITLAFILVIIAVGLFVVSLYFGGARETKNAVDAGALNVGKKALDITVNISGDEKEQFFKDVTNGGKVSLRNINRVWGKAVMVAVNCEAAGGHAGSGGTSAKACYQGATAISDRLSDKLKTPSQLYGFFNEVAKENPLRMLGIGSTIDVLAGAGWQTSLMSRGAESNIEVTDNLPVGYSLKPAFTTACTRDPAPPQSAGKTFLRGYTPLSVSGLNFWQIPFKFQEKPHLVAQSSFKAEQQPPHALPASWEKAVPNAFSVAGETTKTAGGAMQAMSWVQSNPQEAYKLQFPHGFVRVVLKKNKLQWRPNGIAAGSTTYGFTYDTKNSVPYVVGCGSMSATAYVGLEYIPPTLYKAICAVPPVGGSAMDYLLQRVKEMDPSYTMSKLIGILNLCIISTEDKEQEFYIYPNPATGDIVATPASLTVMPSGLDKDAEPDGSEYTLESEGPFPFPNFAIEKFDCYGHYEFPTLVLLNGDRKWKSGTGYKSGCLGELTIERTTDVYIFGICPCP